MQHLAQALREMPSALTNIGFKAPTHEFDATIQEGLAFVSLDNDNLVDKTSYYDGYSTKSLGRLPCRHDGLRPFHDYLHSTRSPLRTLDRVRQAQETHAWSRHAELLAESEETPCIPGFDIAYGTSTDLDSPSSPPSRHDPDSVLTFRSFIDRYNVLNRKTTRWKPQHLELH